MSDNQNPYQNNPYAGDPNMNPYAGDPNQYYQTDPNQYGQPDMGYNPQPQPGMTYQDTSLGDPYGQTPQQDPYGQMPQQDPYGQGPQQDPYGQTPQYTSDQGNGNPYDGSMNYVTGQQSDPGYNAGPYAGTVYNGGSQDYNKNLNNPYQNSQYQSGQNQNSYTTGHPTGNSGLGIMALILSIIGCCSLISIILAVVDLAKKDGRKKGCAIAALVINLIWIIVSIIVGLNGEAISKKLQEAIEKEYGYTTTESHTEATTEAYDSDDYSFDFTTESSDALDDSGDKVDVDTSGFDAQAVADSLNIESYTKTGEYYNQYYLIVENTSDYALDFDVNVKYYDESDNLIGTEDSSNYAIDMGNKAVFIFYPDDGFAKVEYKVVPSASQYYMPATDAIDYDISENPEKLVVTVKNISENDIDNVEARCLFFKDGDVVGADVNYFMGSDYNLKAGEEVSKELNCYEEFDKYEIYFYPRKANY